MGSIYGIDLGTTYCAASVFQSQTTINVAVDENRATLASEVFLEDDGDGLRAYVGSRAFDAMKDAVDGEGKFIVGSKREMGTLLDARGYREPPWRFGSWAYDPRDVASLILRKLALEVGRQRPSDPVKRAVITHPAFFPIPAKEATKQAAELADIEVVDTITEPGAAALAYGVQSKGAGKYVVFDLGGGTLDVTLLDIDGNGTIHLVHHDGERALGGIDWDRELLGIVVEQFCQSYTDVDFDRDADERTQSIWLRRARDLKIDLSNSDSVRAARFDLRCNGEVLRQKATVTRGQFEARCAGLLRRCEAVVERAMQQAGWRWPNVSDVLLVGGSTRMPMVRDLLSRMASREIRPHLAPDHCVAAGAAFRGAMISRGSGDGGGSPLEVTDGATTAAPADLVLPAMRDTTARDLRVLVRQIGGAETCDLVIPRGTATPHRQSVHYETAHDNQETITVRLFEGEDESPDINTPVGTVLVTGIPKRPSGQPVQISFDVSHGGCLEVVVTDEGSGTSVRSRLDVANASVTDLDARRAHLSAIHVE